jgi:mono/diheme cytochrome c family protein
VLAAVQEPELQSQPQQQTGRPTDRSHLFLGLGRVPDAAAAKRGEGLYQQNCLACHGAQARGGIGPNLVRSVLVLHDDKGEEIAPFLKEGRPQSGMPSFAQLTDAQRYDIAEYLHMEIELAANRGLYKHSGEMTSGDVSKGKDFFAANCASCHSVTGDLAGIGKKFEQPSAMLARIAWPSKRGARQATVTTPDGKELTGTLEHYDDFETSFKTSDGKTLTWPTAKVLVAIPDKLEGHRALLSKYTDDDLHNLTRYLLTLK